MNIEKQITLLISVCTYRQVSTFKGLYSVVWQVLVGSSAFIRNIRFERSVFLCARVCKRSVFCLKMGLYQVCIFVTKGLYGYLGTLRLPFRPLLKIEMLLWTPTK